ncbi:MAG TPA: sugar ABC transporter ATP-binding protein [Fimbriimonas sp.]
MPFLQLNRITKRFGATLALDGVDLAVEQGEVHALVGENGSGKSTLMRVLAGAIQADSGSMSLDGAAYRPRSPMDARRAGIAMIHQELSLCPHLSVAENVMLGVEETSLGMLKRSEMRGRATEALAKLGHPDLNPETEVRHLPIALRQLVEIARAVAVGSRVVILDEPTSSLTEKDVERLFGVIETLRGEGQAIVYISHFLDELERIADRLTVLRDGRNVGVLPAAETTADEIVSRMVGRQIESMYPRSPRTAGEPLLQIEGLQGVQKPVEASLEVRRNEVVGIAGLNGSGRTELLRTVFGLDRVRRGEVRVGAVSGPASPSRRWSQGIGMLSEDRKLEGLALNMSIADNITLASLRGAIVRPQEQERQAREWIAKLAVRCQGPGQAVGELSGGNQQKVAIARLLHHGVDVLLLDEPTRGIDVGSKEQIYRLIDGLANEGKAVLVVSSYLPELLGVCDRVAVMRKGVLGEAKDVETLDQESLMHEAVGA